ncbi:uncharacterized protein CTHT_0051020 [Thermochaetoides thermophila DSM 1495]|uniref:Uncharacterized protein n=1 Tax=Chaetomium thermophilum (strain DSM 1495 / CBS 144.50 / IMI 039719) TaxID=759272 RepID=G0SD99_CHATD|nr:hypothetical protein CTHT_0051020 [Thermochaetoides thermophila DSM 1495]EGS18500.1 hypothetical protein CTHT_0051020 [Thermochaetoides thermophila DSM 1495]
MTSNIFPHSQPSVLTPSPPTAPISAPLPLAVLLSLTSFLLLVTLLVHILPYYKSYLSASSEVSCLLETSDYLLAEADTYTHEVSKLPRLSDRVRLSKLVREFRREAEALRKEVNSLVLRRGQHQEHGRGEGLALRPIARLGWAVYKGRLDERIRRVDVLRVRLLVAQVGVISNTIAESTPPPTRENSPGLGVIYEEKPLDAPPTPPLTPKTMPRKGWDSSESFNTTELTPAKQKLTLQTDCVDTSSRKGWAGVVRELQKSPLLKERHASIELAMSRAA